MRRMFVLMYALVFLDEIALLGLVPLLPGYTRAYDLSTTEAGALLSAAPLAIVIASIPAGRLSDRLGSRRVTLAAGVLIALSTAGTAAASGFALLLVTRAAFGLASGTIWSAGLAWIGDSASDVRRSAALGTVITVAGVGGMAGPVFCGFLAEHVGRGAPWAVVSAATVVVVIALAAANPGRSVAHRAPAAPPHHRQDAQRAAARRRPRDHAARRCRRRGRQPDRAAPAVRQRPLGGPDRALVLGRRRDLHRGERCDHAHGRTGGVAPGGGLLRRAPGGDPAARPRELGDRRRRLHGARAVRRRRAPVHDRLSAGRRRLDQARPRDRHRERPPRPRLGSGQLRRAARRRRHRRHDRRPGGLRPARRLLPRHGRLDPALGPARSRCPRRRPPRDPRHRPGDDRDDLPRPRRGAAHHRARLPGAAPVLPAARLGRARPRRDPPHRPRGGRRRAARRRDRRRRPRRGRDHEPARDDGRVESRRPPAPPRDRVAGPADGGAVPRRFRPA